MFTLILITIMAGTLLLDYFFFSLIVRMLIKRSGMTGLARRYPAAYRPAGDTRRLYFAMLGGVRFRRSVSVTPSDEGLYLEITGFFQWLAKPQPALIPWNEVRMAGKQRYSGLDGTDLAIGDPAAGSLWMLDKDFEAVEPYLKDDTYS